MPKITRVQARQIIKQYVDNSGHKCWPTVNTRSVNSSPWVSLKLKDKGHIRVGLRRTVWVHYRGNVPNNSRGKPMNLVRVQECTAMQCVNPWHFEPRERSHMRPDTFKKPVYDENNRLVLEDLSYHKVEK